VTERDRYFVYVDEAGDRGWGGQSSPVFLLTAVVVHDRDDVLLREALDDINKKLGREPNHVLHWAENVREHSDRKMAAGRLADTPAWFIAVVLCKESLDSSTGLSDPVSQYNYCVRRLLERISWLMNQQRPRGRATLRFAHVRRFKYERLTAYLVLLKQRQTTIVWEAFSGHPRIEAPAQIRGLQAADLAAGAVYSATRPDRYGNWEPTYLIALGPRLWSRPTRKLETYGVHFIGGPGCAETFTWLPDLRAAAGC
jgi:hypothetical protein